VVVRPGDEARPGDGVLFAGETDALRSAGAFDDDEAAAAGGAAGARAGETGFSGAAAGARAGETGLGAVAASGRPGLAEAGARPGLGSARKPFSTAEVCTGAGRNGSWPGRCAPVRSARRATRAAIESGRSAAEDDGPAPREEPAPGEVGGPGEPSLGVEASIDRGGAATNGGGDWFRTWRGWARVSDELRSAQLLAARMAGGAPGRRRRTRGATNGPGSGSGRPWLARQAAREGLSSPRKGRGQS
jgi:hypothetical protein